MRTCLCEWVVGAVRAPLHQVIPALLASRLGAPPAAEALSGLWREGIPIRPDDGKGSAFSAAFQLVDSDWTVILYGIFGFEEEDARDAHEDALRLSAHFQARALTCCASSEGRTLAYGLFACGAEVERVQWTDDVRARFPAGAAARQARLAELDRFDFLEHVFREEELYLPACYPSFSREEGGGISPQLVWSQGGLSVEGLPASAVLRADLLDLSRCRRR
jgi:hypothetical protein